MNWDDLRFFLAVARNGKLTAAAETLGVDHATVGRRVAALEKATRSRLFDRSPRGYALTEAGQRLLPFAEGVETSVLAAADVVGEQAHELSGAVRVGMPEGAASHLVTEAAIDLCRRHRELDLQVVALARSFSLSHREADFAIVVTPPQSRRLKVEKISDYGLALYASERYLAARPPVRAVADLRRLRAVGYVQDMIFDRGLDYLSEIGAELHPRLTSTSLLVQLAFTLAGAGVCILPDFMAEDRPTLRKVLPEETSFRRSYWLVTHRDLAPLARIRRTSRALAEAMRRRLEAVSAPEGAAPGR